MLGEEAMNEKRIFRTVLLLTTTCTLTACGGAGDDHGSYRHLPPVQSIDIPVQTDDGWDTASLAAVGIDVMPIIDAVNMVRSGAYNEIHGLVIVKDGKLVLEEYGRGRMYSHGSPDNLGPTIDFDRDELHIVHSVSKSYMSTLVGIAIQEGYIESDRSSLLAHFPEHHDPNQPGKTEILLEHVMSMTSGLEWNEWDVAALDFENSDALRFQRALDPSAYFFGKPLIHEPGTSFYYNTGGFQMMGEVLRRSTGMSLDQFAAQQLFDPLGITDFYWPQFEHGAVYIVGDIYLRPRDMAKLGQLVLQGGQWGGQQIVPSEWIERATTGFISVADVGYKGYEDYGLFWWLKSFEVDGQEIEAIHSDGLAGQAIMIFPVLDLVVVVTGGNYGGASLEHELVANHILPAVIR
jgi:CubicO group peptidase (beta-lactamase class C family)